MPRVERPDWWPKGLKATKPLWLVLRYMMTEGPGGRFHGYQLRRGTGLSAGTVYPLLERLVSDNLLELEWEDAEPVDRPRRCYYKIADRHKIVAVFEILVDKFDPAPSRHGASIPGVLGGHA